MAHWLKNIVIDRVDLVKRGANPDAHIMLYKSKDPIEPIKFGKAMTTNQILAYRAAWDDWYELKDAFMCSISQIMYDGADAGLLKLTVEEFAAANAQIGKVLESTVTKTADTLTLKVLFDKLAEAVKKDNAVAEITALFGKFESQKGDIMKFDKSKLPAEAQAEIAAIEKSATDQAAEIVTLKKSVEDLTEKLTKATAATATIEEIKKGMTPAQLAAFESIEKQNKANDERIAKAEETARVEKTIRRTGEFRKFAEVKLKHLPGLDMDAISKLLLNAEDKMEKAEFESLQKTLETASAAIEKGGLLSESGSGSHAAGSGGVVAKELEQKAEELRKADPKLTKEQSIAKAFDKDKTLYQRLRDEEAA